MFFLFVNKKQQVFFFSKKKQKVDIQTYHWINYNTFLFLSYAGIVPDTKQDDQLEIQVRVDHHDDQNSTKNSLISSYKKNIYPSLKVEIERNFQNPASGTAARAKSTQKRLSFHLM